MLLSDKYLKKYLKSVPRDLEKRFEAIPLTHPQIKEFDFYVAGSATYSANIEGNTVKFDTYLKFKKFGGIKKTREIEEIKNLELAYMFAQKNSLSLKGILKAHAILSKTLLIKSKQGKIRNEKVGVFGERGLVYLAIEPELVKNETKKLFSEINNLIKKKFSMAESFYYAALMHLVFVKIHPFMDGNGRAARLLEKWFLAEKLGNRAWHIESEKYYYKNRNDYYHNVHIGVNYHELNYEKSFTFLLMLPESLNP